MKLLKFLIAATFVLTFWSQTTFSGDNNVRIDIMYFHATVRCHGCLTIEANINNSVNSLYSNELKDSSFTLTSIDFLQPENEHFQDDYKFDAQTLIISKKVNGKEVKWKNLDKIWDFSSDYEKFRKYIEEEISNFIKES